MKKRLFILLSMALLLGFVGCTKRCRCAKYDGTATYYSKQEVNERGVGCSDMIYLDHIRYYSLCEWTYKN